MRAFEHASAGQQHLSGRSGEDPSTDQRLRTTETTRKTTCDMKKVSFRRARKLLPRSENLPRKYAHAVLPTCSMLGERADENYHYLCSP